MPSDAPWSADANVIAFDAPSGKTVEALARGREERFLGVAGRPRASVRHNNADVLILYGKSCLALGYVRNFRHAGWVALPVKPSMWSVLGFAAALLQCLLRTLEWPCIVSAGVDQTGPQLAAFRVRCRHGGARVRNFIPHRLGVDGFFAQLRAGGHRHAVLRWFESLPNVDAGEDVDLLVDDQSLDSVRALLTEGPGLQPVDVYSVTGLPGSDYRGMPYFPPYLAEQILDGATLHNGLCGVPSARDHFLSLAYHAMYHKGTRSGLPTESGASTPLNLAEHDYGAWLQKLARAACVEPPHTMEDVDRLLEAHGWRPPDDMLVRLSRHNPWLRDRLASATVSDADHGLAVFLVRQRALERGGLERAKALIERHGFTVARSVRLTPEQSQAAAKNIRGGNWGRGPWSTSGGLPAAVVVAYDMEPVAPTRRQKKSFPCLANARLLCKNDIRDQFNAGLPTDQHANVIHSSDNGREALDYLRIIMPGEVEAVRAAVAGLRQDYGTDEPVLATRTKSGRRAKVEIVRHAGRLAVRKTFKAHQLRFCQRETAALRELSASVPEAPPVLAAGESWLIIPYYDDVLRYKRSSGKLLPLAVAKQAIAALRKVHEAGYAIVDASVDNLLVDRDEGLKLFDFEFCYRYPVKPARFEDSYDIAGPPAGFEGDQPIQGGNSYDRNWRPYIGLRLASLLDDPTWLQHLKRVLYFTGHFYRFVPRLARYYVRSLVAALLGAASRPSLPRADGDLEADARQAA
jgi:hypothetical protein